MARLLVWSLLVPTCLGFVPAALHRTGVTATACGAPSSAAATSAARHWGSAAAPRAFSSIVPRRAAGASDGPNVEDVYAEADAVFAMIDLDGNGSIEEDELRAHLLQCGYTDSAIDQIFDALDENWDGVLEPAELRQGFLNFPPLREAPGMGMAGVFDREFVEEVHEESDVIFASIDTDGDGTISDVELREYLVGRGYADKAVTKIFAALDVNSDGDLSNIELRDAFVRYSALRFATGLEQLRPGDPEISVPPL